MKKLFLIFGVVLVLSCSKDYKKMIVGTWECVEENSNIQTEKFTNLGRYECVLRSGDMMVIGKYTINDDLDLITIDGFIMENGTPKSEHRVQYMIVDLSDDEMTLDLDYINSDTNIYKSWFNTYKRK